MKSFLQSIKDWTKDKSEHLTDNLKETIQQLTTTSTISIEDLATIILLHPYTQIEQKEYLGLMFNSCSLKLEDYELFLETKGPNHEYILECTIKQEGHIISSYHSYKHNNNKIRVPEQILSKGDKSLLH